MLFRCFIFLLNQYTMMRKVVIRKKELICINSVISTFILITNINDDAVTPADDLFYNDIIK